MRRYLQTTRKDRISIWNRMEYSITITLKKSTTMVRPRVRSGPNIARTQVAKKNTGMGATRKKAERKTSFKIENILMKCHDR